MPSTVPLNESGQVTLDGSGNGFVALGPLYTAQTWVPTQLNVNANVAPLIEPTFKYYRGTAGPSNYLGGTYTGSNDSTDISGITINPGEKIYGVWSGGSPGTLMAMTLQGTINIP
jgi:hypothetical protein